VQFELRGLCDAVWLRRYSVSQRELDRADLRIEPGTEFSVSSATASFQDHPAPMSLTIYSSNHLAHDTPGVIAQ
jgi:hypothetical protein